MWAYVTQATLKETHLGGHDQLVVHYVVWGVAHSKERAGGVQMARHPRPDIHILPNSLGKTHDRWPIRNTLLNCAATLPL